MYAFRITVDLLLSLGGNEWWFLMNYFSSLMIGLLAFYDGLVDVLFVSVCWFDSLLDSQL